VRRIAALAKLAGRVLVLTITQRLRVVLRIYDDWGALLRWLFELEHVRWLHANLHSHFKVPHVRGVRARVLYDRYRRELRLPGESRSDAAADLLTNHANVTLVADLVTAVPWRAQEVRAAAVKVGRHFDPPLAIVIVSAARPW
jgi:hypothetical protein